MTTRHVQLFAATLAVFSLAVAYWTHCPKPAQALSRDIEAKLEKGSAGVLEFDQLARPRAEYRERYHLAKWALFPCIGVLVTALYVTRLPLVVRVELSDAALSDLVERAERMPDGVPVPRDRSRPMSVDHVVVHERCVFLTTDSSLDYHTYGLACSRVDGGEPGGRLRGRRTTFRHLTGRWWMFHKYPAGW